MSFTGSILKAYIARATIIIKNLSLFLRKIADNMRSIIMIPGGTIE
jgi:hypothetical protein